MNPTWVIMRGDGSGWHLPLRPQAYEGIQLYTILCNPKSRINGFVTSYQGLRETG